MLTSTRNRKLDSSTLAKLLASAALIVIGGVLTAYVINFHAANISSDPAHWGVLGDYFGGLLGPTLNFVVLLVVLRTMSIEKEQKAEATFFLLLDLHLKIVSEMEFIKPVYGPSGESKDEKRRVGKRALQSLYYNFSDKFSEKFGTRTNRKTAYDSASPINEYETWYLDYQHKLGHYFRNFYQILKFLDTSGMSHAKQKFCADVLRAQLSTYEQTLLAYNGLSRFGTKAKHLIETFGMLEHGDEELFVDGGDKTRYRDEAFLMK